MRFRDSSFCVSLLSYHQQLKSIISQMANKTEMKWKFSTVIMKCTQRIMVSWKSVPHTSSLNSSLPRLYMSLSSSILNFKFSEKCKGRFPKKNLFGSLPPPPLYGPFAIKSSWKISNHPPPPILNRKFYFFRNLPWSKLSSDYARSRSKSWNNTRLQTSSMS